MRTLACLAVALAALAGSAHAQMVSRSEDGSVAYVLGAPTGLDQPVIVNRGDSAWAEWIRPAEVVRTTSEGIARPGELRAAAIPANSILFAYTLRRGAAYCPLIAPNQQRVQCFRDFDGDGTFEGNYVTISRGFDSIVLPGGLRGLIGMPRVTYQPASVDDAPGVLSQVVFAGFRNDVARFRVRVEDDWFDEPISCTMTEEGLCDVFGLRLRISALSDDRAQIELVGQAPQRGMRICFDTEAPGSGCPQR